MLSRNKTAEEKMGCIIAVVGEELLAVRLVSDPGLAWGGLSLCREERKLTSENAKMWREKQCLQ